MLTPTSQAPGHWGRTSPSSTSGQTPRDPRPLEAAANMLGEKTGQNQAGVPGFLCRQVDPSHFQGCSPSQELCKPLALHDLPHVASHVAAPENTAPSKHTACKQLVFGSNSCTQHTITDSYSCSYTRSTRKTGSDSNVPVKVSAPCLIPGTTASPIPGHGD